jgi:hypothetical protein
VLTARIAHIAARCALVLVGLGPLDFQPATAHQQVDPAILRLVKPRTNQPPGTIRRPPGDPLVEKGRNTSEPMN